MTPAIVLTAMLALGVTGGKGPVSIYVGPMVRDGFVDVDKGVLDSIKDIQGALRKDRAFVVVAVEADATLKLYVVARTTAPAGPAGGVVVGNVVIAIQDEIRQIETLLRVGDHERAFTGGGAGWTWGQGARAVMKDLSAWVAANRERIP
jgi:hypothetical protein